MLAAPLSLSEAASLRHALRDARAEAERLRRAGGAASARADAAAAEAGAARRAGAAAAAGAERLAREVAALRAARDAAAAALEDVNAYAKRLESKVAGPGGFLVDQNARLRAALADATAAHAVSGGARAGARARGRAP